MDGTDLVLQLSGRRRWRASTRHPGPAARSRVRVVDSAWEGELRGWRAPGTGLPERHRGGDASGGFGKDFAAVHGTGRAVVVELEGADFGRLV